MPLDPDYPGERLAFMLKDTRTPVLLTQQRLLERLPGFEGHIVCLDRSGDEIGANSPVNPKPNPSLTAHSLAYVIYTSGSTGQPKGVMVEHQALSNLCYAARDQYELTNRDRVFQFSSFSFDTSLEQMVPPLLVGAVVVLATHRLLDVDDLDECIRRHGITVLDIPTTLFGLWSKRIISGKQQPEFLRLIIQGGEALAPDPVVAWMGVRDQKARLVNAYGPTEATITTTLYPVPIGFEQSGVPIGRPIGNSRVYILDSDLAPCPIGVSGELHIGGEGLARGYLNRPELTGEKFVPDPFSAVEGARMYRTGDLARYRADGNIEFLGRIDQQVKIRGFRIELGEIESVMALHPAVQQAVVLAREDAQGDKRLVGYIVATDGAQIEAASLRDHLKQHLPDYMHPASYVMLERMPLAHSGKVDRRALLAKGPDHIGRAGIPIAPRDELELGLSGVWANVLGLETLGVEDSFFDLGGHSLTAIRLMLEIRRQLGFDIPIATLFEAPTVSKMASKLRTSFAEVAGELCLVAVQPLGSRPPLFILPGAGGELFSLHHLGVALGSDQPLYVLNLYGFGGGDAGRSSGTLSQIAARIVHDIRQIQPAGPYQLAGYSLGGRIAYEVAQQLRRDGQDLGMLMMLDSASPGYFRKAPLRNRILTQMRAAASQGPGQALGYFARRLQWKRVRQFLSPTAVSFNVARDLPDAETLPTESIAAIQRSLDVVFKAWSQYRAEPYRGDLVLLRASWGEKTKPGVIDADPYLGWKHWVHGGVQLEHLACWHSEILRPPQAEALAGILRRYLAQPNEPQCESDR